MKLYALDLELRGMVMKASKNGGQYIVLNMEDEDGTSVQLVSKNLSLTSSGYNKGDHVQATCLYDARYKNLTVIDLLPVKR